LQGAESVPDITELRHVPSSAERRAAEEVASRQACADFSQARRLVPGWNFT
jgi:hypothetical protein